MILIYALPLKQALVDWWRQNFPNLSQSHHSKTPLEFWKPMTCKTFQRMMI